MIKKIAISQSNYIPWKGYFDNIALVDEFVIYDDMQYTKRDWRNRNKIKTANGLKWLTIPVEVKGKYFQKIKDTKISNKNWSFSHLEKLKHNYTKSPYYKEIMPFVEEMYLGSKSLNSISEINTFFIQRICDFLGINTKISFSWDYELIGDNPTDKLVNICLQSSATDYYTGPAAKNYMDESAFNKKEIHVHYYDYSGYKEYTQLHGDFEHGVTILDLLFNEGINSMNFLKFNN